MKFALAIVAAMLAIVGNVPYVREVLRGRVQPHAYSWFVWTIVSFTVFFGQVIKGAGVGAIPTAASEVFTLAIFLLSLRYGFKRRTRTDTIFLVIALFGLVPWALTKDPTLSVVIAVSLDLIAFFPTFRKTREAPGTERPLLYATNVARHALALLSLEAYNIATMLHSIVMICANTAMTYLIMRKKEK